MVRINLINPEKLADQHLIAEYNEILMLLSYIKISPDGDIPRNYRLGKGHMKFFKNKLGYLKERHDLIKKEMQKRGFKTNKSINVNGKNWTPSKKDKEIIKKRLREKIVLKPDYYKYYGINRKKEFFLNMLK